LKPEYWLKIEVLLQGVFGPIQSQAKKALVCSFGSINQGSIVLGNHLQALCDHQM